MSTPAAVVLGVGLGMLAAQVIAVGGVLVADLWLDWVRLGRADKDYAMLVHARYLAS